MTRKSTVEERTRICLRCDRPFFDKPSRKRKYCSHRCAFAVNGGKTLAAALTPEAIKKNADARRGSGAGRGYIKRNGRHEHRIIAEQKIGRPLLPGEIAHHADENKRNNAPDNIEVLANQGDHSRLHFTGKKHPPKMVCKYGHPLQGDNVTITSIGRRRCLTCQRTYDRNWKRQRRIANQETTAP